MSKEQINYYIDKLSYEMDSWDLSVALEAKDSIVVVDGRTKEAYLAEHIPNAINLPHRDKYLTKIYHIF